MEENLKINNLNKKVRIIKIRFYIEPKQKGGGLCDAKNLSRRIYIGKDSN